MVLVVAVVAALVVVAVVAMVLANGLLDDCRIFRMLKYSRRESMSNAFGSEWERCLFACWPFRLASVGTTVFRCVRFLTCSPDALSAWELNFLFLIEIGQKSCDNHQHCRQSNAGQVKQYRALGSVRILPFEQKPKHSNRLFFITEKFPSLAKKKQFRIQMYTA